MFSWPREEAPVGRGRFWLWIWGDCLERPGLGSVAMGCGGLRVGWEPHLACPGLVGLVE